MGLGNFGFSYVGAAFLVALFVPNLIWAARAKPEGYDASGEPVVLRWLERIGQVLTTATALLLSDTDVAAPSPWTAWLVAAILLMLAYEACWIRYFRGPRTMTEFYRPFLGIPVPLASLPVTAFVLLGVYGRVIPLIVSAVVLGVGHVGIHVVHWNALRR